MAYISAVIPVYKSKDCLIELHTRLKRVLESIGDKYEIIFVEDCGNDGAWEVILQICQEDPHTRGIRLSRNFGQHNALLCGIREARYDITLTLDDDLQHPPEEIPKLVGKLEEGYDVVYGPPREEQHGLWRDTASLITKSALRKILGAKIAKDVCAFRVFRTRLREAFSSFSGPFVSIDVLLSWGAGRFGAVPVPHEARTKGKSNYTLGKLASHAFNMITGFSVWPLRVASIVGFVFTLFGMAVLVYVLGRYWTEGGTVRGFPFLASIIAIFSGAQLFALGILGEYLARMHFKILDKPSYLVSERMDHR